MRKTKKRRSKTMSTEEGLEELDEELTDDEDSDIELPPINLSDIFAKEYEK